MFLVISVDSTTGESIGHLIQLSSSLKVNSINVIPSISKKNRPSYVVLIDVDEEHVDGVVEVLVRELGITGYRVIECAHHSIPFDFVNVTVKCSRAGVEEAVRVKRVYHKGEVVFVKAEFDDLVRLSRILSERGVIKPIRLMKRIVESAALSGMLEVNI